MSDVISFDPIGDFGPAIARCQHSPSAESSGRQTWKVNRCATFITAAHIRPSDQFVQDPEHPLANKQGYTELITVAPIRGTGRLRTSDGDPAGELCSYHRAQVAVSPQGHSLALMCNHPEPADPDTKLNVLGYPFVADKEMRPRMPNLWRLLKEGYTYFVGGYRTPPTVEIHLTSEHAYCGDPV